MQGGLHLKLSPPGNNVLIITERGIPAMRMRECGRKKNESAFLWLESFAEVKKFSLSTIFNIIEVNNVG